MGRHAPLYKTCKILIKCLLRWSYSSSLYLQCQIIPVEYEKQYQLNVCFWLKHNTRYWIVHLDGFDQIDTCSKWLDSFLFFVLFHFDRLGYSYHHSSPTHHIYRHWSHQLCIHAYLYHHSYILSHHCHVGSLPFCHNICTLECIVLCLLCISLQLI